MKNKLIIVPSSRIDYCSACKADHGYDCPKDWKLTKFSYRDIHGSNFIEATCPHGIGHHKGVHGCDGCCAEAPDEIWSKVTEEEPQYE